MSYQEKRAIVSLISTIVIALVYFAYIWQRYQDSGPVDDFSFWGAVILLYVPVQVVSKIIILVVFIVINYVATQEEEPGFSDELDQLIDLKATRNFYHVFMLGFLLAMAALALNLPPLVMFLLFMGALIVAGLILDASQIYFYRKGV